MTETVDMTAVMAEIDGLKSQITDITAVNKDLQGSIDQFFILVMGVICFLMQAGFGLLEVGSIRGKNASNIMLKNMMDASVSAVAYFFFGYSVAYGADGNGFIGGGGLMTLPVNEISNEDMIIWYFNYVFAGTTATIVSGAVAERCQFRAYLIYSFCLAAFIYPVCSHWIWSEDGFLNGKTYDFAGGGAVHMVGGAAAAMGSIFLGPRKGKFIFDKTKGKKVPVEIPGHSATLAILGTLILWFGFFAFNGGSSYTIATAPLYNDTGRAVVCTTLGGAFGGLTTMIWGYFVTKSWNVSWTINGLLGGMVAICSPANTMSPWAACILGVLGATATQGQVLLFEHVLFIDDPLNASAVHFAAGAVGMIWVAFMGDPEYVSDEFVGIFYGGSAKFLGYQFWGMFVYTAWTVATSGIMFGTLKFLGWLRVSEEEEELGMDISHHGGKAYPDDDEFLKPESDDITPESAPEES